jgi:hypothetical protein
MIATSCLRSLILLAALLGPQEKRSPVPGAAAQKEAEKLVREIFKEDYSRKSAADRIALGSKLLRQASETRDDPVSSFVLLREARDLAAQATDAATALQAITEMGKRFEINAVEMKAAALASVAKAARSAEEFVPLAKAYLTVADEALALEDFPSAENAVSAGSQAAKKGKDLALISKLEAKSKELGEVKACSARMTKAKESLAKNPGDAEANFVLGQYLCVARGEWDAGLKHLSQGIEPIFRAAANRDLAGPTTPADRVAAGDAWWDLGEKENDSARSRLRTRAAFWYLQAQDQVTGLTRARLDKRLEAAGAIPPVREGVDLLKLIDPETDAIQATWKSVDGKLISPPDPMARVQVPYAPPEEYDLHLVVERNQQAPESVNLGLVAGGSRVMVYIDGWDGTRSCLGALRGATEAEATYKGKILEEDRPNTIVCSVRKKRLTVTVNGTAIIDWVADYRRTCLDPSWTTPNPKALVLGTYRTRYLISKCLLVPVSGEGKALR